MTRVVLAAAHLDSDPNTPTTVIGLRDRAAPATVSATREAGRNLCAEAAKRGSPAARAGGLCRPEPDSAFAPTLAGMNYGSASV